MLIKLLILIILLTILTVTSSLLSIFCFRLKLKSLIIGLPTNKFLYTTTWNNINIKITRFPFFDTSLEIENDSIRKKIAWVISMLFFVLLFTVILITYGSHQHLLADKYNLKYENTSTIIQIISSDAKNVIDFTRDSYADFYAPIINLNNKTSTKMFDLFNSFNIYSAFCYLSLISILYLLIANFLEILNEYTNINISLILSCLLVLVIIFMIIGDIVDLTKLR